jgi:lipoprotein-releasing system permease protein
MRLLLLEIAIAIRYLKAKKQEAFISIISTLSLLGIMLGCAALVVVMAVMNGYRLELTQKLKGFNSDLTITGHNYKLKDFNSVANKLKSMPEVKLTVPVINERSLAVVNESISGILIKGIKNKDMKAYPYLIGKGIKRPDGIIIGNHLARSQGVSVGDTIKILSPRLEPKMIGPPRPQTHDFYIEGLFRSGMSEYDSAYVVMPLEAAQKLFDMQGSISRFEVFLAEGTDSRKFAHRISEMFGFKYRVLDWQMMNQNIFNALKTEKVVMFVILAFIIIVAAFNIISSLVMMVTDKTKEIAILRTIGFSRSSIMRIFLIAGMMLGVVGTMLGVASGVWIASNINTIKEFLSSISGVTLFDPIVYYLDALPAKTDMQDVVRVSALALGIAFVSALYPAYKASSLSPAKGLKND